MNRLTPAAQAANFQRELDFAGNPFGLDPGGGQTLRIAAGAAVGTLGVALGVVAGATFAIGLFLLVGVGVGFYLPGLWLDPAGRPLAPGVLPPLPNRAAGGSR